MLPKGWLAKELDDVCEKISVGLAISVTPFMRPSGVKLIRNQNIKRNYFDSSSVVFIDEDFAKSNKSKMVRRGDVVAVRTGSNIGEACVVPQEFEGALTFTTLIARPKENLLDSFYLATHINSEIGINEVNRLCAGGGKPNLNSGELKHYRISTPPLAEQKKIAQILSTWDQAIATTERLLDLARQQKKALMQQLLTGKKRFPGFEGKWKRIHLKAVLYEEKARNRSNLIDRVLSITNHSGFVLPEEQFSKRVASDDVSNYKIVKKGQFGYNPSRLNVGSFSRLDRFEEGLLSPMYVVFSINPDQLNSDYFLNWMQSNEAQQRINGSTQGSVRDSVGFDALCGFPFLLPSIKEQGKIASILSAADQEIETLQSQLDGLKQEKKALMQQLLTGKVRVKVMENHK
ncbi:restriction endonuclease subunit S [Iodobacter ciconiae]|uniref:Restriction endonuclease subunit S n=1 Tax=Iodobacter ciconiae TaxID=2496266 RepID=A0A3S8ZTD6_9NEIS|nr:restriction endonuclease subunit S [Iodobacter ciconiae]AZN36729.1 restriction endonuclease subunit S [Iodobacter ciconiae]